MLIGMSRPDTPQVAVDTIIRLVDRPDCPFVLIERKYPPFGWAIPGGFVDVGETLERAAIREALEETSLQVELEVLLGIYSDPARDHRGHTATAVYIANARGEPKAMDDAKNIQLFHFDHLPQLAFDHDMILEDYRQYLQTGRLPAPRC